MKTKNNFQEIDKPTSINRIIGRKFFKNKLTLLGIFIFVTLFLFSFLTPLFVKLDPLVNDLLNMESSPNQLNILGTDDIGRDVFSRLVYGGQVSILIGIFATMLALFIGTILGLISGYFGGKIDFFIMRITDTFMCFPFFVMAISISAIIQGNMISIIIIIGILSWPKLCRIVRASIISLKSLEFVEAAVVVGVKPINVVLKHILPNILPQILVFSTIAMADAIITEASLSFLGMGIKVPISSWGNMLSSAQNLRILTSKWWMYVPAGLMIVLLIISINLIGEGFRNALSPSD